MNHLSIVILAAGNGKRMHSPLPKVLQPLAGVPMLERVVTTAKSIHPDEVIVVYGNHGAVPKSLPNLDVKWVHQEEPLGTAHAVLQALPSIEDTQNVLILYGDVPLISKETIYRLIQSTPQKALGLITACFDHPYGFGRIVRDASHHIMKIVEEKDASPEEKEIQEINTGILLVPAAYLKKCIPQVNNQNAQKEYYLTDIVRQAREDEYEVYGIKAANSDEVRGVNTLKELICLERAYQYQTACQFLDQGVLIKDPKRFDLRGNLKVGQGVTLDVNVILEGNVVIGSQCYIGPNTCLKDVTLGDHVIIQPNSVIEGAVIQNHCLVGPFARIRPGTHLSSHARVGNFVEIKNTQLGEGSKANHLTYLGDAVIEDCVNIGAGVITCNYDGVNKHQTHIESGVFIGSDVQLIAPVTVHKNATVGAGSTITENVPENTLAIARSRQVIVRGWERSKVSEDEK